MDQGGAGKFEFQDWIYLGMFFIGWSELNQHQKFEHTKKIGIFCTGIDFISSDINIPYNINKARILELNYKPDITIHLNNEPIKNNFYNTILKNM